MVGELPAQSVDAEILCELSGALHLGVTVVPDEQDVAPVQKRQVAAGAPLLVSHRAEVVNRDVELAALSVSRVALGRRAVDRERHLVYAGVHEAARLLLVEREAVRARVQIILRELRLDVLAHFDRALVEERLAVIEEVDPRQRGSNFVDDPPEQIEIEHAGFPRASDPGFRCAARLVARDVAGRRAFDEHARGKRPGVERPRRRGLIFPKGHLQRAVAAEFRSASVELLAQPHDRWSAPDLADRHLARIAEHAVGVRIGAAADDAAVAEHDEHLPRPGTAEASSQEVQGHR